MAASGALVLVPAALAEGCSPADGYGQSLAAYVGEAKACLAQTGNVATVMQSQMLDLINADRAAAGQAPLQRREGLDQAAQAHALDMAMRGFVSHDDQEGRDHLFRIRAFERSMLFGATGANLMVVKSACDAKLVYDAIQEDPVNAANLSRDGFTHTGIGIVQRDGQTYVVQVFATAEGELKQAMPVTLKASTSLKARLNDPYLQTGGWNLTDQASGERLDGGTVSRLAGKSLYGSNLAALDIYVKQATGLYPLNGPLVSAE